MSRIKPKIRDNDIKKETVNADLKNAMQDSNNFGEILMILNAAIAKLFQNATNTRHSSTSQQTS